ncbi:MAG: hypothetical protein [Microvirus sp.]|nr:MAG: hypothetical protein [Microvirus sp.]
MRKRHKMGRKHSRRSFSKHANSVHRKNHRPVVMRGGIRL